MLPLQGGVGSRHQEGEAIGAEGPCFSLAVGVRGYKVWTQEPGFRSWYYFVLPVQPRASYLSLPWSPLL